MYRIVAYIYISGQTIYLSCLVDNKRGKLNLKNINFVNQKKKKNNQLFTKNETSMQLYRSMQFIIIFTEIWKNMIKTINHRILIFIHYKTSTFQIKIILGEL